MDTERIAGLTAEIKGQLWLMQKVSDSPWERLCQRLQSRVNDGLDTPGQLDSVAYQIHNLYCSAEDLLKLIASSFENQIGAGGDWHRVMLLRLSQPVEGIRPAFLSATSLEVMNKLRSFRHLIRHAYGTEIELTQLQANLSAAQRLYGLLQQDINIFLAQLTDTSS
ncbi:hypothetical protein [Leptolyngbya sp. BC1307]|uniref:ribonuclease toxin HepT-like protein n=1 Tax=Leptolyngbya sp. BC1307 TaxID=2029589 RepID=UPI000EFC5AA3|nr:hypothetical protein [Leptolyngbya sp. BC1307]